jgi:galactose mutarotase-like enzyme
MGISKTPVKVDLMSKRTRIGHDRATGNCGVNCAVEAEQAHALARRRDAAAIDRELAVARRDDGDGEEGYPGNVNATEVYTLNQRNELTID